MTSFYTQQEIEELGFASVGKNVLISRKASFYERRNIYIGNNVRIDDFCILSGNIKIGSNIHISSYVAIYGAKGVEMDDYTGLSPRVTIYSAMDDFGGDFLVGPIHEEHLTNVTGGKVYICKYAHIGANSTVFPNVVIEEGAVVGAHSLVNKSLSAWGVYAGVPAKWLKERGKNMINLAY